MSERITVRLPQNLLNRAKHKAAVEGRTLTSLIEDGLRMVMAQTKNPPKKARLLPRVSKAVGVPVSKAVGGPMPGVDITRLSALQEIEDLEYVERMKQFRSD